MSDDAILIVYGVLLVVAVVGYILNGVQIWRAPRWTPFAALRVAGVFCPPIGVVLGFIPNRRKI